MNILVVIPDSDIGGITTAAVNFCNELCQRGHSVTLLDMSGKYQCATQLSSSVARGHFTGKSRLWRLGADDLKKAHGARRIMFATLGIIKKLTIRSGLWYRLIFKKYKEFGSFDAALAFRQCAPCYSFVLNRVKAKKKLGFVHGELTYMGDISSWRKHMRKFDKIAYVSHAVKDQFVKEYPHLAKNACTIYNMMDTAFITEAAKEQNPFSFDRNKVNIVTVSRIDSEFKRIDWIPEICKQLLTKTTKPFHWYIVGDGPGRALVEQKIAELQVEDCITLCGMQKNPYAILKDADFSVLLSKSESFGLVVVESLLLGAPAVVAEYPALKEIMTDGKHGYIIDPTIENAVLKITQMIDSAEVRNAMRAELRDFAHNNGIAYRQFWEAVT